MSLDQLKAAYWTYFTNSKYPKPFGATPKRLEKVRGLLQNDNTFWNDIWRHGCNRYANPEDWATHMDKETIEHCLGNFYGMIVQTMLEEGIIKP
jgi:hypothetical protein